MLPGSRRLRVSSDTLSLRELLAVVESGVSYWRRRLEHSEGVAREQAVAAIKDLSQILDSLAAQLAQGRETVRITSRLPAQRTYPLACGLCGRGNRAQARYCVACGAPLLPGLKPPTVRPDKLSLVIAARSDTGMVRSNNEDTIYSGEFSTADGSLGTLLLVADGMGGHQAGDVASQMAVATLKQELTTELQNGVPTEDAGWHDLLHRAVAAANQRVYRQARENSDQRGMGTTLTAVIVADRRAHVAHVGDTRAYLLNAAGVSGEGITWSQITSDHSLVARLVDIGQLTPDQARTHPQRNMLYRSLGTDPVTEVDTLSQALAPGDVLVLCSDGLISYVEDSELAQIVLGETSAQRACDQLVDLANQRGGSDNISVLVARVR